MNRVECYKSVEHLDNLCERFGYQLDQLDRSQKLQIRVVLSFYLLGLDHMGDTYSINDAWMESLQQIMCDDALIIECLDILQGISVRDTESLLSALQAQCRIGNARLKTPVETATSDLVSRGVPEELAKQAAYIVHKVDNIRSRTTDEQTLIYQVHGILLKGR